MYYCWVLKKANGDYVALPGSEESYTWDICKAQRFKSDTDAENNACGNEYPTPIDEELS